MVPIHRINVGEQRLDREAQGILPAGMGLQLTKAKPLRTPPCLSWATFLLSYKISKVVGSTMPSIPWLYEAQKSAFTLGAVYFTHRIQTPTRHVNCYYLQIEQPNSFRAHFLDENCSKPCRHK